MNQAQDQNSSEGQQKADERLWEALQHEHEMLRAEIVQRMSLHHSLLSWASAVLVGIVGLGVLGGKDQPIIAELALAILTPLLGCAVGAQVHAYNVLMERVGEYLFWLERKAALLVGTREVSVAWQSSRNLFADRYKIPEEEAAFLDWPFGWEHWIRASGRHYHGLYRFRGVAVMLLPLVSGAVAIVYWMANPQSRYVVLMHNIGASPNWAILIAVGAYGLIGIPYGLWVRRLDRSIGRDLSSGPLKVRWDVAPKENG